MESASRADGNYDFTAPPPMRSAVAQPQEEREESASEVGIKRYLSVATFIVFLVGFGTLANLLEGITADTLFMALFCASVSMFIVKAMLTGMRSRRESEL